MNNEEIGVTGQYGPDRTIFDKDMAKFYKPRENYNGGPPSVIGVTGQYSDARTPWDAILAMKFNPGHVKESYVPSRPLGAVAAVDEPDNPMSRYFSYIPLNSGVKFPQ